MNRMILSLLCLIGVNASAFTVSISSDDFVTMPEFSEVETFNFAISIDETFGAGSFQNPMLESVVYQVQGVLEPGTPSTFPAFDLQRTITGTDFYDQGSSLNFEISTVADLSDGLQADELMPNSEGVIFTFNGREVDNGRFHPALFVLNQDGTGSIRNSNNVPMLDPLLEVDFGAEYITNITFDAGNLTLVEALPSASPTPMSSGGNGGGGSVSFVLSLVLLLLVSIKAIVKKLR